jgi:hypothetical protein
MSLLFKLIKNMNFESTKTSHKQQNYCSLLNHQISGITQLLTFILLKLFIYSYLKVKG